jgi:hypothetical protein
MEKELRKGSQLINVDNCLNCYPSYLCYGIRHLYTRRIGESAFECLKEKLGDSESRRLPDSASRGVANSPTQRVGESSTPRLGEPGSRYEISIRIF